MKRIMLLLCAVSAFAIAQDAAGQYKLSAVHVEYTYVSKGDVVLTATTNQLGVPYTQALTTIPGAVPFTTQKMELTDAALSAIGINLNVTLNEDGSGSISEGSYYPDVNTIEDENGNCVTLQQVLPVTDEFTYTSNANLGLSTGGYNVLGLPGISEASGMGGLGLSGSLTFEDYPMIPSHPTLCDPSNTDCFDFTVGDIDGSGTLEIYPDVNLLGIPEYVPGGAPLTGITGGLWKKVGVNAESLTSIWPGNTAPDFYLEWHGVDGGSSGLGDPNETPDIDDDGDGTWFDREVGIPGIVATYLNPACGFNQPVFGDVSAAFAAAGLGSCVDYVDAAASGYVMDPSGALASWGNFATANAIAFGGCLQQTGGDPAPCMDYMVDDSGQDFDGTSGRLTFDFDVPCVGVIEAREVLAEFIEVGGGDCGSGDMNSDGGLNVLDVVALVNTVLGGGSDSCVGDMNLDGGLNVLDVVALVNTVLGGRLDGATSAEFNKIGNEVTMTANGYVGAVQMTLSHSADFSIELTNDALVAEFLTNGNTTTIMIVNPNSNSLFTTNNDFTIESVLAASNSEDYMKTKINVPSDFIISEAYPNPFNPTTQMSLTLNTAADVVVNVFNMNGQLVDVLANGQMSSGSYSFTWDGTNASSGVYFIKTQVGSEIHSQKIMLVK